MLGFPGGTVVKNVPMQEMQESWAKSQGWENPLEQEMATHSSILAWRIPWTEEPGGLQSTGSQRVRHNCGFADMDTAVIDDIGLHHFPAIRLLNLRD